MGVAIGAKRISIVMDRRFGLLYTTMINDNIHCVRIKPTPLCFVEYLLK